VKRAADLLGHRVEVHSAEGRGSCFTVAASAVQPQAELPGSCVRLRGRTTAATT
jgi:hypothetical protein